MLCMRAACRRWQAVICADTAHVNVDECGAPEMVAGVKLLTAPEQEGKLTPEAVARLIARVGDEHAVQPGLLTISQSTELGTVYTLSELRALVELAHSHGLLVHVDGARLSNAAAALGLPLRALTTDAGSTSCPSAAPRTGCSAARRWSSCAPSSPTGLPSSASSRCNWPPRCVFSPRSSRPCWRAICGCAAPRRPMRWRPSWPHALGDVPGLTITRPVQANAVFALLPAEVTPRLQERFPFYVWDEHTGEVRWMCSWDTTDEDVETFAATVHEALA